jgi:hypothetical protein
MKAGGNAFARAASAEVSPPEIAMETLCLVSDRRHFLSAMRSHLEAEILVDRLHWRMHLFHLLVIYQELEDCSVTQAIAPHLGAAPQKGLKRAITRASVTPKQDRQLKSS